MTNLIVEAGFGSTLFTDPATITWTDITGRVDAVGTGVQIRRGAADELSQIQSGTCTLSLDNSDGAVTAGLATSPYYPHVRMGVPIRVSVAVIPERTGSAPYPLSMLGDNFDAPTLSSLWANAYGGAGVVDGRARIPVTPGAGAGLQSVREWRLTGGSVCARLSTLPAVNGSSSVRVNLLLDSQTAGTRIGWQYNAVNGTLRAISEVGFTDGASTDLTYSGIDHLWVRVREAAGTVYWETSGDGWDWTVRRTMATPAWSATNSVMVSFTSARTGGTADYVEWDLLGATVYSRFGGAVNEWPTRWKGLYATATITCSDIFALLSRQPQLRSVLDEEVLRDEPIAYYPLTEPSGSASAGDLSGHTAGALSMVQIGGGGSIAFGAGTGPAATGESVPEFTPGGVSDGLYLTADLGADYESLSTGQWNHVEFWLSTTLLAARVICAIRSVDDIYQLVFSLTAAGSLQIEYVSGAAGTVTVPVTSGLLADGEQHHVVYDESAQTVHVDGVSVPVGGIGLMFRLRMLTVGGYNNTRLWEGTVSHLALYTSASSPLGPTLALHYTAGATAFAGETADLRIQRLAGYAGIGVVTIDGTTHDALTGQGPGGQTAVARMTEVEQTESGKLFATRDGAGLTYQSRDVRYNPAPEEEVFVIAYADLETDEVEIKADDQKMINTVVASRPGGATQRVIDAASRDAYGTYEPPGAFAVLKQSDASVVAAAQWLVSRYADPLTEVREVPIEAYSLAAYPDILSGDISKFFSVTGLPAEAPAASMRVTIEGYSETIRHNSHRIQFHTSRSDTDSVWVLNDPAYSVLGTTTRLAY